MEIDYFQLQYIIFGLFFFFFFEKNPSFKIAMSERAGGRASASSEIYLLVNLYG